MFRISEVSKLIGVSAATLRRWDRSGLLKPNRTLGNHRRYSRRQISDYLPEKKINIIQKTNTEKKSIIIYARVSSAKQKSDGNLDRQVDRLKKFCKREYGSEFPVRVIQEYGSGLNSGRKGLWRLIKRVKENKVERVVIAYKDRLTRFGFPFLEEICSVFSVPIIEVEINERSTLEDQLVVDMMSLIASFSGKLYKLRALRSKGILC